MDDEPKRCLVLIDLQNEFLTPTGNFPADATCQQALLENVSKAAQYFHASGDTVFWVRAEYTTGSSPTPGSDLLRGTHTGKTPCCEPNTVGAEFLESVAALRAPQDVVITKTRYSAFTGTTLRAELTARGITNVYIGGLLTNICVRATAEEARALGLAVTVLQDCLGWRRYKSHQQALRAMRQCGVQVAMRHEVFGIPEREPVLYYVNGSIPSWRVLMALYEKEISFTAVRLKVMSDPKETRLPAFLELNHRGKTPMLIDPLLNADGSIGEKVTINESIAILHYIETYHRPERPLLPPVEQRSARALALARIQETENLHNIYDALEDAHFEREKSGEPLDPEERAELAANVHAELDYWEVYASRTAYIAGDEFGLADCAFSRCLDTWCIVDLIGSGRRQRATRLRKEAADAWPHLRAYFDRVWGTRAREGVREASSTCWVGPTRQDEYLDRNTGWIVRTTCHQLVTLLDFAERYFADHVPVLQKKKLAVKLSWTQTQLSAGFIWWLRKSLAILSCGAGRRRRLAKGGIRVDWHYL
ncbi:Isochorismatase-like protein [Mycena polygramma]|nr:Isochorismatase-like protein [Mycena polygramma]